MTADMSALIARLEAAEVGSRELDGEIALAFSYPRDVWGDAFDRPFAVDGPAFHNDAATWSGGGKSWSAPTFTTSLDAALTLAERVLPGWGFYLRTDKDGHGVGLTYPEYSRVTPGHVEHKGSLPLALCIALLRAKQGEGE